MHDLFATGLHVDLLRGLFFGPEDGRNLFFRNFSGLSNNTALHPRG
jgi:hypothetical protein